MGGTGFSRCQQRAPVVGRFVFQLSLVLGLSPRTRLGCGYGVSRCFSGLDGAGLPPAGAGEASSPGTACHGACQSQPCSLRSGGEGRWPPVLAGTAAPLTAPRQRLRDFFFGVSAPPSESPGPAAGRQQTARPAPESGIHASAALSTETLLLPALGLSPPLNVVKVGFPFTAEPPPSPFLMPFSS